MLETTLQRPIEGSVKRLAQFNKDRSGEVHECTSCGTRVESAATACPNCTSEIWRPTTSIPHVRFNLVVVLLGTGIGILRRIATGEIAPE